MNKYNWGMRRISFEGGLPRLFLHERHEQAVRWTLRSITAIGITASVLSLPWYYSLLLAVLLVIADVFFERTLFYYSSLHINAFLENYNPEEWVATAYSFVGESPEDPESLKIVSPAFKTQEYAQRFFRTLHEWSGNADRNQGDLRLSFIIDESRYYIFLYADPENERFMRQVDEIGEENKLKKYGKEHFPIAFQMVICKGFDVGNLFSLGLFHDNCAPGNKFVLTPFLWNDGNPIPLPGASELEIEMNNYKWKIPTELSRDDYEYYHWHKIINRSH